MIRINGEEREPENISINDYLKKYGYDGNRIVVELNLEIIPRQEWKFRMIQDEDSMEILQFVGGG